MNISFDNETKLALLENLKKKNKEYVRLTLTGYGWGGPILGVALDEQKENDVTFLMDEVPFVIEDDVAFIFENSKITRKKGFFGDRFTIITSVVQPSTCK